MVNIIMRTVMVAAFALMSASAGIYASAPLPDAIFSPKVRTVTLRNAADFMAPSVIRLGSDDGLVLGFDIIGDSHDYLRYRIIRCDHDWRPSRLLESEYLDSFNEAVVEDYAYSSNTFVRYVNYKIEIPGRGPRPTAGGNYIIQVYREDSPDDILLQKRFSVSEEIAPISGKVSAETDKGFNNIWQQASFSVDLSAIEEIDPYRDLKVVVTQNNRSDTGRMPATPLRVEGRKAVFAHNPDLVFKAGNEYRRFETVKADGPGMHVDSVVFSEGRRKAFLAVDYPRAGGHYSYDSTQHGRFMIDEYNASDPDLGADYIDVVFTLVMPRLEGYDMFLGGELTGNGRLPGSRMEYDPEKGAYRLTLPLKQGSYNYQYLACRSNSQETLDPSVIEGDFFETDNEYLVKVFYSPPGTRSDRLIATAVLQ